MLPVLAKADSMTGPELERFRQHVRSEMYRVRALQPTAGLCCQPGMPVVSSREGGSNQLAILRVQLGLQRFQIAAVTAHAGVSLLALHQGPEACSLFISDLKVDGAVSTRAAPAACQIAVQQLCPQACPVQPELDVNLPRMLELS